jgi:GNAT superfamily N-acetyltransferase
VPGTPTIRPAEMRDIPTMQDIEIVGCQIFAEIGMQEIADDGAHESELLAEYVAGGRAWVAEADGEVAGYALADMYDGTAHVEQVTIYPRFARRGIGGALLDTVERWGRERGSTALTLLTFRDVAWNGPYYRRLGFVDVPDDQLAPELAALRAHEAELGLDVSIRCAMRRPNS